MRTFTMSETAFDQVGPIKVAEWAQYGLADRTLPFDAMWYTVPAHSSSERDCHPELELSIVVAGTAHVEIGGEVTAVTTGNAFLLTSEEAHVVHNRSADPLTIFSGYWMPLASSD